jgi:hypothetical protein
MFCSAGPSACFLDARLGESLGDWSIRIVSQIAYSIISALPGLLVVLIIFVMTFVILKILKVVLNQVAAGRLYIPGLHPETVGATRKLIAVIVWLFALSAAYPFRRGLTHWHLKVSAFLA